MILFKCYILCTMLYCFLDLPTLQTATYVIGSVRYTIKNISNNSKVYPGLVDGDGNSPTGTIVFREIQTGKRVTYKNGLLTGRFAVYCSKKAVLISSMNLKFDNDKRSGEHGRLVTANVNPSSSDFSDFNIYSCNETNLVDHLFFLFDAERFDYFFEYLLEDAMSFGSEILSFANAGDPISTKKSQLLEEFVFVSKGKYYSKFEKGILVSMQVNTPIIEDIYFTNGKGKDSAMLKRNYLIGDFIIKCNDRTAYAKGLEIMYNDYYDSYFIMAHVVYKFEEGTVIYACDWWDLPIALLHLFDPSKYYHGDKAQRSNVRILHFSQIDEDNKCYYDSLIYKDIRYYFKKFRFVTSADIESIKDWNRCPTSSALTSFHIAVIALGGFAVLSLIVMFCLDCFGIISIKLRKADVEVWFWKGRTLSKQID